MKRKVAIACQGGGSHSAFTAGVLRGVLEAKNEGAPFEIVAISGTSGGAICALLAWHGLITDDLPRSIANLEAFWTRTRPRGNAVASWPITPMEFYDSFLNTSLTWASRSHLPHVCPVTPSTNFNPYFSDIIADTLYPPLGEAISDMCDGRLVLRELVEEYLDDRAIHDVQRSDNIRPLLLVGAVDVCTGEFQLFRSSDSGFGLNAVVASAAIPTLMKAVTLVYESPNGTHRGTYWDGLFSQNPPLRELPELLVQAHEADERCDEETKLEIWLIRINPSTCDSEPRDIEEIRDRRNELAGNLSLEQELYFIERINEWIKEGRRINETSGEDKRHYHEVTIRTVFLPSRELEQRGLRMDAASKHERNETFLKTLLSEGERLSAECTHPVEI